MATTGLARTIGPASLAEWPGVSAALGAAFVDDPVLSWLIPTTDRRAAALRRFFALESREIALEHGCSVAAHGPTGIEGAALVLPPGHWRAPFGVQLRHGAGFTRVFGHRLPLALGVLTRMEQHHVRDPHYYVAYIGVAPAAQGLGVGSALLEPVLARADRESLPAYLEASSPRSARLYARLGFERIETIRPFGSPPIELMLRAPRP